MLGRRHDGYMLRVSGLLPQLRQMCVLHGRTVCIYGDPAYPLHSYLQVGFKGDNLNARQRDFNKKMSGVRESVEWCFKDIYANFAFLNFSKNCQILKSPVAKYHIVGALMKNALACCGKCSEHAKHFGTRPMSMEQYFSL